MLRWGLSLAVVYIIVQWLFIPLLPFLIALAIAVIIEPCVLFCLKRLRFKRKFSAVVFSTLLLGIGLGLLIWLPIRLFSEAAMWLSQLPAALEGLPGLLKKAEQRYHSFLTACPEEIEQLVAKGVSRMAEEGPGLLGELSGTMLGRASACLSHLPYLLLFSVTTLLAIYYTALSYPELVRFVKRQIPVPWQNYAGGVVQSLRSTLWKWLKAESLMLLITFCLLLTGFWLLRMPYALFLSFVITLVDALPVLGSGAILIPWGIFQLLLGDIPAGIALLLLYAIVTLSRSLLEPKLMAAQVGLPPLATLMAMYLGYSLFGLKGMFLLPAALLFIKQLQDCGFICLWK